MQGDFRVHDPSLIKQDATYYVFSTGDERYHNGMIQIRRSSDLATWELIGSVFDKAPDWIANELGSAPPNLWAPDVAFFNGKYYLYYAASRFGTNNSVIGLATNTTLDPESADYKWVDEGMITRSRVSFNWNAIDPNLVVDAQGTPWLALGSFWDGIKLMRLDATGKVSHEDTKLYRLASRGGGPIEAPFIVAHEGFYYLFVSFDSCCKGVNSTYKIMVGRSQAISGPYADQSGKAMTEGGSTLLLESNGRFIGPGGQSVYLDGDVYRLVNHYYDGDDNGAPKLQVHDLTWGDDGWPVVSRQ